MTSTAKSAVSEYEHLKFKLASLGCRTNEEEEEDFLPLKPLQHPRSVGGIVGVSVDNSNNAVPAYHNLEHDKLRLAPVPVPWSPGMILLQNPSLDITPEKFVGARRASPVGKDAHDIHCLQDAPKPVAMSPGMEKPQPSIFVTPTKLPSPFTKNSSLDLKDNRVSTSTINNTETTSTKSVRFDLPSQSSGDDTNLETDSDFAPESPIVLRGKGVSQTEDSLSGSPTWKCFSPQRSYNPNAYSDESFASESSESVPSDRNSAPTDNLSTSVNLQDRLKELLLASEELQAKQDTHFNAGSNVQNTSPTSNHNSGSKRTCSPNSSKNKTIQNRRSASKGDVGPCSNDSNKVGLQSSTDSKGIQKHSRSNLAGPPNMKKPASLYEPLGPSACVVRESKHPSESLDYSFPFNLGAVGGDNDYEHAFARPEFNSTLKVRNELDQLCDRDIDMEKALSLKLSEGKRSEIQEKASCYTNQLSDQFKDLVTLEPSVESLCQRAVHVQTCKIRSKKKRVGPEAKKQTETSKAPDLLEFFPSDLQKEFPDLSLPGVTPYTFGLQTAPAGAAFDVYRHYRATHGTRDFP